MRSSLVDYLQDDPSVTIDRQAAAKDQNHPASVTVTFIEGSFAHVLELASRSMNRFCAIVRDDGSIFVLTAGGSGEIAVCGEQANFKQQAAIDKLTAILRSMGAIQPDS